MTPAEIAAARERLMALAAELAPDARDRAGLMLVCAGQALGESAWPHELTPTISAKARDTMMLACWHRMAELNGLVASCVGEA